MAARRQRVSSDSEEVWLFVQARLSNKGGQRRRGGCCQAFSYSCALCFSTPPPHARARTPFLYKQVIWNLSIRLSKGGGQFAVWLAFVLPSSSTMAQIPWRMVSQEEKWC